MAEMMAGRDLNVRQYGNMIYLEHTDPLPATLLAWALAGPK
jgi:hypothetical protein